MRPAMTTVRWVVALALGLGAATPRAAAQAGTITDGAAWLWYPEDHWTSPEGHASLVGVDPNGGVLFGSSWWYRTTVGDTREHRFPPPDSVTYDGGLLHAHWNNVGDLFAADEYTWVFDHEGPSGAFFSELIVDPFANLSAMLFHYVDVAAGGDFGGDSGVALGPRFMKFSDGPGVLRYRASSQAVASEVKPYVGAGSALLDKLDDGDVDQLDDTGLPSGPADPTAAYQFHVLLDVGERARLWVSLSSNLPGDGQKGEFRRPGAGFSELHFQGSGTNANTDRGWLMRRTARYEERSLGLPANVRYAGADDFYGEYESRRLLHNQTTGQLIIDAATPVTGAPPLPLEWQVAATGDLDGDGKADVLWRNTNTQKLLVWLLDGDAKVGERVPSPDQAVHAQWEVVGLADFDDDGQRDFLWYNQTTGKLVIWYMDANQVRITGGFTNPASVGNKNWKALAVADFGRGPGGLWATPDIVWQNDTSGKLVVWHMNWGGVRASGTFTTPDSPGELIWEVYGPR